MKTTKLLSVIAAAFMAFGVVQVAYADTTTAQAPNLVNSANKPSSSQGAEYVFIMEAKSGQISKNKNGTYELTLSQVDPKTLYFSERPNRINGFMDTGKFVADWAKQGSSFSVNPPNVAITHASLDGNQDGFVQAIPLELRNPKVNAGKITFAINNLDKSKIQAQKLTNLKVFIDGNWSVFR